MHTKERGNTVHVLQGCPALLLSLKLAGRHQPQAWPLSSLPSPLPPHPPPRLAQIYFFPCRLATHLAHSPLQVSSPSASGHLPTQTVQKKKVALSSVSFYASTNLLLFLSVLLNHHCCSVLILFCNTGPNPISLILGTPQAFLGCRRSIRRSIPLPLR